MLEDLRWKTLQARRRDSRLQLMYNIAHNNTAVSAEELGMVAADGRTKANHRFTFRAIGAVTAQLHGSFVARTIPEWNIKYCRLLQLMQPHQLHSTRSWMPYRSISGSAGSRLSCLSLLCAIRRWPSHDS